MIPFASPHSQYKKLSKEIQAAIRLVLTSGEYILGPQVDSFEKEFAAYLNVPDVVGCANGTDALMLALRAHNIGVGDEVIIPSHTATASVAAVSICGATPIFADIELDYYTLDIRDVMRKCTSRTKAIIAVHLYGQPANMKELLSVARKHNLILIEDCAQAVGSAINGQKLGSIGDIGCFSFFPTKNLGAFGDAGAVACRNPAIAVRLKRLRQYGWNEERISVESGLNSRLDELQAAILRVKLPRLDANNEERLIQANRYHSAFLKLPVRSPLVRPGALHSYHLFVIRVAACDRDLLVSYLAKKGIKCGIHYATPVHKMPYFASKVALPNTEKIVNEIVSLPLFPGLKLHEQKRVITAVHSFFDEKM
ncbi:DegT/DnrJ/EryC1/StrS aminotransferase family protein [Polynucleobacter sp. MWH-Braz-FAM2G]|uniref:DegT/DnrJ/EryC1/StrS family aminotransferase n=1 Tax=Polynucleobacter sp. MWH-Braz-FAM2G TaxID=1855883 RepID=UPI001BFEE4E0|nr:DegT/DnrJ/EryC1/StrS family aminotransferase [Polynucleobacter sp. MWH-Braz-FAM2G]QWD91087.1 DegT/DnrJ/EryC1/StrS family aminotransferase [Polynucleobacter sp. MWH-Braz-FAM2G]